MSILIKGMAMPKNCIFCELYEADWHWCRAAKKEYYETIENKAHPDWCPLIELPPHGDLIERDKLVFEDDYYGWRDKQVVKAAPTIIEAEGE